MKSLYLCMFLLLDACTSETTQDLPLDCQNGSTAGQDYLGSGSTTLSGLTCQRWSATSPHSHPFTDVGDHNYCRNPPGDTSGVWCYTEDPDKRFEFCAVPECSTGNEGLIIKDNTSLPSRLSPGPAIGWSALHLPFHPGVPG